MLRETIGELVDTIGEAKLDELWIEQIGESTVDHEVAMTGEADLNGLSAALEFSLFLEVSFDDQPQWPVLMDDTLAAIFSQMQIGLG